MTTASQPTPIDYDRTLRRSGKRFMMPAVVLGLLGGHVVFIVTAITLATGDRSFAVVPDYYQKAVDYDERKAQLAQSQALGWRVELQADDALSTTGERGVTVRLTDREGAQVPGAALSVSCYHLSNAGEPVHFELTEALSGEYVGSSALGREGFWWFEVTAQRNDQRYIHEFKQFLWQAEVTP